jgi:hypothetical protein
MWRTLLDPMRKRKTEPRAKKDDLYDEEQTQLYK